MTGTAELAAIGCDIRSETPSQKLQSMPSLAHPTFSWLENFENSSIGGPSPIGECIVPKAREAYYSPDSFRFIVCLRTAYRAGFPHKSQRRQGQLCWRLESWS